MNDERELVEAFADRLGIRLVYFIPRDSIVQHAEHRRRYLAIDRKVSAQ